MPENKDAKSDNTIARAQKTYRFKIYIRNCQYFI